MAEFLSSDPAIQDAHPHTTYDLLANICHDGPAGQTAGSSTACDNVFALRRSWQGHLQGSLKTQGELRGCLLRVMAYNNTTGL